MATKKEKPRLTADTVRVVGGTYVRKDAKGKLTDMRTLVMLTEVPERGQLRFASVLNPGSGRAFVKLGEKALGAWVLTSMPDGSAPVAGNVPRTPAASPARKPSTEPDAARKARAPKRAADAELG